MATVKPDTKVHRQLSLALSHDSRRARLTVDTVQTQRPLGFADVGALSSRSVMLPELLLLLAAAPADASAEDFRRCAVDEDALHKPSVANRRKTFGYLRRLYAIDGQVALFREFRRLAKLAPAELPTLAALLAFARDPLLRTAADSVVQAPVGKALGRQDFEAWVRERYPARFTGAMYRSFSHNLYASFFQLGYLSGAVAKLRLRRRPKLGPASTAYAAFLDWLRGKNGLSLLSAEHSRLLDLTRAEHLALLTSAGQMGLMRVANAGGVLQLDFSAWLRAGEARLPYPPAP